MNQYYNPQGFQPYPGAAGQQQGDPRVPGGGQSFYPAPGAQGFPQFPPAGAGSGQQGRLQGKHRASCQLSSRTSKIFYA